MFHLKGDAGGVYTPTVVCELSLPCRESSVPGKGHEVPGHLSGVPKGPDNMFGAPTCDKDDYTPTSG